MNAISILYDTFWSESIWVPPGYTWDVFSPDKVGLNVPDSRDLRTYPFIFAGVFVFIKSFVARPCIFMPIWNYFTKKSGLKQERNDILDKLFAKYDGRPPKYEISAAGKKLEWDERKLSGYVRRNGKYWRDLSKFLDCSWQLSYYVLYLLFGVYVLCDKEWFYDIRICWRKYPLHELTDDVWWYYMIPLGFYYSQIIFDITSTNRRKDSTQMLIHHFATILLMTLSFTVNMVRMGCLVLFVHECADIPLLLAKICGYIGKKKYMDPLFVIFVLLWVVTRLGIFPFKLIKSTVFEAHVQEKMFFPVYYIFNGLLLMILLMHLVWTYYIGVIIYNKFETNEVSDVRSSEESGEEQEQEDKTERHTN